MKYVARILGIVGGVGAIVWAIRDRFVSVAISREPEPPAFRTSPPIQTRPDPRPSGDGQTASEITSVTGIGPVYATRLESAGISTISDLSASTPDEIASVADVSLSRATDWIEQARQLA